MRCLGSFPFLHVSVLVFGLTLGVAYWVTVVSLLVLGFLSMFTIGFALLLVAAAMIVLSPFRSRPRVWWSGMALVVGSVVGYAAVAPWGCSATETFDVATGVAEEGPTVCRSLTGIEYTGSEGVRTEQGSRHDRRGDTRSTCSLGCLDSDPHQRKPEANADVATQID